MPDTPCKRLRANLSAALKNDAWLSARTRAMANNGDGWPADAIFEQVSSGYTYDDILLMPGFVGFGIDDVPPTQTE